MQPMYYERRNDKVSLSDGIAVIERNAAALEQTLGLKDPENSTERQLIRKQVDYQRSIEKAALSIAKKALTKARLQEDENPDRALAHLVKFMKTVETPEERLVYAVAMRLVDEDSEQMAEEAKGTIGIN